VKRGLITWDKTEIPPAVFEQRIHRVRQVLADRAVSALVVYSELWRSNPARFFSNYMPYFNRAFLIIPRDVPPTLLCGLSPRVYGWIRSVTTIEDVRPAGTFAKPLFEIAGERGWTRIGALDLDQFPSDLHKAIHSGTLETVNIESPAVYVPAEDESEREMRRKAAAMASRILGEEMPNGVGMVDHHFVGRLEGRFRKAGAEDLIVLLTNGYTVPAPPSGAMIEENYSLSLALEYRGHWVRLSRPQASPEVLTECRKQLDSEQGMAERMDGSYPYEYGAGGIMARHVEVAVGGKRLFYGETIL
jgi:hypothetical protein